MITPSSMHGVQIQDMLLALSDRLIYQAGEKKMMNIIQCKNCGSNLNYQQSPGKTLCSNIKCKYYYGHPATISYEPNSADEARNQAKEQE